MKGQNDQVPKMALVWDSKSWYRFSSAYLNKRGFEN